MRVVSMAGWGALAGLCSEEEAWDWILPAAKKLQQSYRSWEDLGEGYTLGCKFWSAGHEAECRQMMAQLKNDPQSPWNTVSWRTNLSQKEKGGGGRFMRRLAGCGCTLVLGSAGAVLVLAIGGGLVGYLAWSGAFDGVLAAVNAGSVAAGPAWDGKAPLVCQGTEHLTITGTQATFSEGVAITARANCTLDLVDVSIDAPTALRAEGNAHVTVTGGSLKGSEAAVSAAGNANVALTGTTLTGETQKAGNAKVSGP